MNNTPNTNPHTPLPPITPGQARIGIFDSGYGGLTILRQIRQLLPQYDYIYLGDNARAPYGSHSFDIIYRYTLQAVQALFQQGCQLVILACNTASAKALRTIQQRDLPTLDPTRRVLGVIRPTVEAVGPLTRTRHIGLLATQGTVNSGSYTLELHKLCPDITVTSLACPMWVPLVENFEYDSPGADYFVKKRIEGIMRLDPDIDTLILGCTHYPLLMNKIVKYTPPCASCHRASTWQQRCASTSCGTPNSTPCFHSAAHATTSAPRAPTNSTKAPPCSCTKMSAPNK